MTGLPELLERTPAWRDGATAVLLENGAALERLGDASSTRLLLRAAELLLAAGLVDPALACAGHLIERPLSDDERARAAFLVRRLAARVPRAPLIGIPRDGTPLGRMRDAVVRAERATYREPNTALRREAWTEVLDEPDAQGFHADELRFLAATQLAPIWLADGQAERARDALERAAELARRYGALRDEASLQMWRYLAFDRLGDRDALRAVGRRAAELPSGVPGALPVSVRSQLEAAERMIGGDVAGAVETLDAGLDDAHRREDWLGYAALAVAKARAFAGLGQPWPAYRSLKLAGSLLRREEGGRPYAALLRAIEDDLRAKVGEATWAAFGERLVTELRESG